MNSSGHFQTVCSKCGVIIAQCRCMDCNKIINYGICDQCKQAPNTTDHQALKDIIIKEYQAGNLVYTTCDGLVSTPVADFITQPADGMLYDLNRLPEVVLTNLDDPKWLNDYAVALTIRALKAKIDVLEGKVKSTNGI